MSSGISEGSSSKVFEEAMRRGTTSHNIRLLLKSVTKQNHPEMYKLVKKSIVSSVLKRSTMKGFVETLEEAYPNVIKSTKEKMSAHVANSLHAPKIQAEPAVLSDVSKDFRHTFELLYV